MDKKHELHLALELEKRLRLDAYRAESGDKPQRQKAVRERWRAVETALNLYMKFYARELPLNEKPPSLPPALLHVFRRMAGCLAVGQVPEFLSDARTEGRREPGPEEKRDIELAIAYLEAVRRGHIDDKHPTKTVAVAYGAKARTVRGWRSKYKMAFANVVGSDDENRANDFDVDALRLLMEQAGERYRKAGRSSEAIRNRTSKVAARN